MAESSEAAGDAPPGWESVAARVAFALVALHVADDSFVQPRPGTDARDHLVGGVVSLVALTVAFVVHPRLRPGARAVLALSLGLVATAGAAAESGYHALESAQAGDDFTGLAMLAAGIALLAVGSMTLWRSRRLEERPARRYARRSLVGLGLSVGGEVLLEAAAETDMLRAVVSEGAGIRSLREALEARGVSHWITAPYWAVTTGATAIFAGRLPPPSLEDVVPRIAPRPVLLVYAAHGQGGENLNPDYFAAAGEPKELWRIPDGGHIGGIDARSGEYERRVVGFFDRALLGGNRTAP